jgi:hypothetical protein
MFNKQFIQQLINDRLLLLLTIGSTLLGLTIIISSILRLQTSDVQLPVRYSEYGLTTLYREQWYYLLSFVGFGFILLAHPILTAKLLQQKSREYAVGFGMLSIIVGLVALLVTLAVFRVASYSL